MKERSSDSYIGRDDFYVHFFSRKFVKNLFRLKFDFSRKELENHLLFFEIRMFRFKIKTYLKILYFFCLLAFIDAFPAVCWVCFSFDKSQSLY